VSQTPVSYQRSDLASLSISLHILHRTPQFAFRFLHLVHKPFIFAMSYRRLDLAFDEFTPRRLFSQSPAMALARASVLAGT
jgi:hypothetical protein